MLRKQVWPILLMFYKNRFMFSPKGYGSWPCDNKTTQNNPSNGSGDRHAAHRYFPMLGCQIPSLHVTSFSFPQQFGREVCTRKGKAKTSSKAKQRLPWASGSAILITAAGVIRNAGFLHFWASVDTLRSLTSLPEGGDFSQTWEM